LCIEGI